jgi:hypothetical protein
LVLTAAIFMAGWIGPEVMPIDAGGSHLLGLRFLPACTPFGVDAFCGLDYFFVAGMALLWFTFWFIGDK